jgi:hypothetical protein
MDSTLVASVLQNMISFRIENKLQQAAITYIAQMLIGSKEMDALATVFDSLDTRGNGYLTKDEMKKAFAAMQVRLTSA